MLLQLNLAFYYTIFRKEKENKSMAVFAMIILLVVGNFSSLMFSYALNIVTLCLLPVITLNFINVHSKW